MRTTEGGRRYRHDERGKWSESFCPSRLSTVEMNTAEHEVCPFPTAGEGFCIAKRGFDLAWRCGARI